MPIYEYRCTACGHEAEFLQKISEPPLSVCPSCHKDTFRKQVSAAGFQLKGTGWYATDFKGNGKKPAEKSSETKSSEAKSEPKSDTPKKDAAPACGQGACPACAD
jgi:putative FmdB family regulatory protein